MMSSTCSYSSIGLTTLDQSSAPASPAGESSVASPSTSFRPVRGARDTTSGEVLLIEAYAAIWLMAFVLIIITIRKQRSLDARISQLRLDLATARAGAPEPGAVGDQSNGEE